MAFNVFVVRLPLTYLNAVEAQSHFNIPPESSVLIILYRDIEYVDIKHIKKLIDAKLWRDVHFLPYNVPALTAEENSGQGSFNRLRRIVNIRRFVAVYHDVLQRYNNTSRVFIGDFNIASMRHIVNCLKPKETILLDEGFNVYRVFNKLQADSERADSIRNFILSLKYRVFDLVFGYKMYRLCNLCFFTSYQFEKTDQINVVPNKYPVIRRGASLKKKSSGIFFLGQCFPEIGAMSEAYYLSYLEKIRTWFSPNSIVYIPHRGDSQSKIDKIENIDGFSVVNLDMPIEFYLACSEFNLPGAIAGFNTSALQNIKNIFNSTLPIYSFVIDSEHLVVEKRQMFDDYYKYLQTLTSDNFSVIKLHDV